MPSEDSGWLSIGILAGRVWRPCTGYCYSPVGNILAKTTEDGLFSYEYHPKLDFLVDVEVPDALPLEDEHYTYDLLGNRLTSADIEGNWAYDHNNRLLSYGDRVLDYDENGNQTLRGAPSDEQTLVYDTKNRLVQVENPEGDVLAEYYYGPFGRRLWKEVGGQRTYFFYAEEGLAAEIDASGDIQKTYGYWPDSTWSTDPLFQKIGSEYYWYQNDHLGTSQVIVDAYGSIKWQGVASAFGETRIVVDQVANNLRFPGQYFDEETGLHYNYFRDYDPATGRYIESDPIGLEGGVNTYIYAKANPMRFVDRLGLVIVTFEYVFGNIFVIIVCPDEPSGCNIVDVGKEIVETQVCYSEHPNPVDYCPEGATQLSCTATCKYQCCGEKRTLPALHCDAQWRGPEV